LDDLGHVVVITPKHNPGAGLKALPGGFIDPVQRSGGATVAEEAVTAALREATVKTTEDVSRVSLNAGDDAKVSLSAYRM